MTFDVPGHDQFVWGGDLMFLQIYAVSITIRIVVSNPSNFNSVRASGFYLQFFMSSLKMHLKCYGTIVAWSCFYYSCDTEGSCGWNGGTDGILAAGLDLEI